MGRESGGSNVVDKKGVDGIEQWQIVFERKGARKEEGGCAVPVLPA